MPRLTVTEIAAAVGVHKSTVSRQARQAGLVGTDGKIDLDAYRALRRDALDPALQTTGPAAEAPPARGEGAQYAAERARKTAADAERAEIELAARKGELISAAGAVAATEDLFRRVRQAVMEVADAVAPDLAMLGEETAIAGHLTLQLEAALERARKGIADAVGRAA